MSQLYPPVLDPKTLTRQVWDTDSARRIPGVGRALDLIGGLISQMPLDQYAGIMPLPRPRFLEQPDLDKVLPLFIRLHLDDYLIHGNAAHLVTARDVTGWPAAVRWFGAHRWHVAEDQGRRRYHLDGIEVDASNVVHVQNGADPLNPCRGVGVVERYVKSLDRIGLQEERERQDSLGGSVPSVAVIAPQSDLSEEEMDEAAALWERKFQGPGRRPGIFPAGTNVIPLAWSPHEAEATAARQLALTDTANMFNLGSYWLGAAASSHTYRSPAPLFLELLRTTLEPILAPFETTWSQAWLPRGRKVAADRSVILTDDMGTTIATLTKATGKPIMTVDEARATIKLAPLGGPAAELAAAPAPMPPAVDPTADPAADPTDPTADPEDTQP